MDCIVWLYLYCLLREPFKNISLILGRYHWQLRAIKISLPSAQTQCTGRNFILLRYLGFCILILGATCFFTRTPLIALEKLKSIDFKVIAYNPGSSLFFKWRFPSLGNVVNNKKKEFSTFSQMIMVSKNLCGYLIHPFCMCDSLGVIKQYFVMITLLRFQTHTITITKVIY